MNIRFLIYRAKLGIANRVLGIAGRLGKWALLRKLDLMGYPQRDRVGALLDREIAALGPSVETYFTHQKTEIEILSARLSRRYDPGAALNEATERAIKAKGVAMLEVARRGGDGLTLADGIQLIAKAPTMHRAPTLPQEDFWTREAARQKAERDANPEPMQELTKNQEAALEHQKRAVKRTIANS